MRQSGFAEFMTVLVCALVVGAGVWGALMYLQGAAQAVALVALGLIIFAAWQLLRKRFGRN